MPSLVTVGVLAALVSSSLIPVLTRWARRRGVVEWPNPRRVHRTDVPTAGGLALAAGFWAAAGFGMWPLAEWTTFLIGSVIILACGLWDDLRGISPWWKLSGQLMAAGVLVAGGTVIEFVTHPFGGMIYLGWWGGPLTLLWVVALTNSLNFIDGLDGLSAGIAAIACVPLAILAAQRGHEGVVLLTVCLLGACLGFLRANFHPARVFMGDTGAMFLGFALAAISVEGALKGAATVALSIPLLALGLPVFDTACAIIRRGRNGRPLYEADAGHVHHRLLQQGFSHRGAVLFLYLVSGLLGGTALVLHQTSHLGRVLLIVLVVSLLGVWAYRLRIFDDRPTFARGRSQDPSGRPGTPAPPMTDSGWSAGS